MVKMLGADGGSVNLNFLGWSNLCRVEVRMRLLTAVATMVAEAIGVIDYREVAAKLGEMATYCEVWRHPMEGVEHLARPTATGPEAVAVAPAGHRAERLAPGTDRLG